MLDFLTPYTEARKPKKPKGPNGDPGASDDDRRKQALKLAQKAAQKTNAQRKRQVKKKAAASKSTKSVTQRRRDSAKKAKKTKEKKAKATMQAALAANKKARQEKKAATKAKKQEPTGTKDKATPVGKAPVEMVPAQIRHCMLALKHKRGKSEKAAWNICRWAMTKYGYLKGPYRVNTKLPKATKQTQKGVRRSFQHGMEKGPLNKGIPGTGASKARKFNKLFKSIEKDVIKKGKR